MAAPSLNLSPFCSTFADEYPFSVKVETKGGASVADLLEMHRDHYEGTQFDMTRGIAGGPYGDPSRFDPHGNKAIYEVMMIYI
jgi:dipeptidase